MALEKRLQKPEFCHHRVGAVSMVGAFVLALLAFCSLSCVTTACAAEKLPAQETMSAPITSLNRGLLSFNKGAFGEAASYFADAACLYEQQAESAKQCEALVWLAQARQFSGQHRSALESLGKALPLARKLQSRHQIAAVLGTIGNVQLAMGESETALRYLNEGLTIARESGYPDVAAAILNNLGNLYISKKQYDEALASYRESAGMAEKAGNISLVAEAEVNGAGAASKGSKLNESCSLLEKATDRIQRVEDSYAKAYSLINIGLLYSDLRLLLPARNKSLVMQAYTSFTEALRVAEKLNDQRTTSYAYGHLANLYEDQLQYQAALELTRRAIFAAQQQNISEALYKWHWQAGRILARRGNLDEAIASYRLSIRDLQVIREEMSSCYANPESSYRKTASGVCFELVDLLLQRASKLKEGEVIEPYLVEARDTLEVLKVFELREYFKDDCIDAARFVNKKLDVVSEKAVVVYPVLLPDRVELLVSFAGRIKRFTLPVGVDELTKETRELRRMLVKRTTWEFLPHSRKLYDWLIRPLETDLNAMKVDTLVFVPDGALRTIPMAALHDGNQFLINRYPIAITPSLNLTDPQPLNREHTRILSLGLTRAVRGFSGLPYVAGELAAIQDLYGGELLLNDQFTLVNVEKALKNDPFSIVHIASHGQFGGNVEDTFLLAFDEKFTMEELGQYVGLFKFREEPLDLLALSACETAAGDDRAALGLAGVAVRAGARSALATLWHVNDPASFELIKEFYHQLKTPAVSRAAALRAAQLKLLNDMRYDHPGYWAPFLLVNNWL
jgi:CHAT domain-containing protein/tetratricopeptide (TPR) repeat protein